LSEWKGKGRKEDHRKMDLINLKVYEGKGNKELAFRRQKLEAIWEDRIGR
jgi:hypothetical protein